MLFSRLLSSCVNYSMATDDILICRFQTCLTGKASSKVKCKILSDMETCAQDIPRLKIVVLTLHIQGHEIKLEEIKLKKSCPMIQIASTL